MRTRLIPILLIATLATTATAGFTRDFFLETCNFTPNGANQFFSLREGAFWRLEGEEDGEFVVVEITVRPNTKVIDFTTPQGFDLSVETRVVEEREWVDGELVEVSKNYFARCKRTDSIFYFGEKVNIYENGVIVSHEGQWKAGRDGAQPGLIMPGIFLVDSKYFQEIAPDVAMDRAKHAAMGLTWETPAGTFEDCVKIVETTPLDPEERSVKIYAPGVGLIYDDGLELVEWNP